MIIALGLRKSYIMSFLSKTENDDFLHELALEFIERAKKANMPSNISAFIKMDIELDQL